MDSRIILTKLISKYPPDIGTVHNVYYTYPPQCAPLIPLIFRGLCAPEDPQGPLEGLPDREAQPGAVPPPGDAQGLQHQREDQPHGDPRPPTHAPLLESKYRSIVPGLFDPKAFQSTCTDGSKQD